MVYELTRLDAYRDAGFDAVIDVRSPSEFAEDHLPGAINLPVLTDAERAQVGTIYVQENAFKARKIGAAMVARNAAAHIETALMQNDGSWRPLVYCWRGGQRSGSFASILEQIGWRVETLKGGYQSYRRLVVSALYDAPFPSPVVLLDGNTGTAKTEVLARLREIGVQVIDLEGLAGHRGSALGAVGEQPSQKAFESRLAAAVADLDPAKPTVIEAESSRVGRVSLPPQIWKAMQAAPRIELSAPVALRAAYLVRAYADLTANPAALMPRLERLVPLQGRARVEEWTGLAETGEYEALARALIEHHYDPRYRKSRARHEAEVTSLEADALDDSGIEQLATDAAEAVARISGN